MIVEEYTVVYALTYHVVRTVRATDAAAAMALGEELGPPIAEDDDHDGVEIVDAYPRKRGSLAWATAT